MRQFTVILAYHTTEEVDAYPSQAIDIDGFVTTVEARRARDAHEAALDELLAGHPGAHSPSVTPMAIFPGAIKMVGEP